MTRFLGAPEAAPSPFWFLLVPTPALGGDEGVGELLLIFLRARSDGVGREFCEDLARVYGVGSASGKTPEQVLQEQAQTADLAAYLVLSRALIDISIWFRRFAQSELKEDSGRNAAQAQPGELHAVP